MSYGIQKTPFQVLSAEGTEQLFSRIDSFRQLAVDVVEEYSAILLILKSRKVHHAFMDHPVLGFFRSILDGRISAEAAILLGNKDMITAILPLPRDRQIAIAKGEEILVATRAPDGTIKSDDLPIRRMDPATMRRAFGPKGIRTVHEQAEMIRAEGRIERRGMFTVLRDEGAVRLGNQKFAPTDPDLRAAFHALGFEIVLACDVPAKASPEQVPA